MNCELWLSRNQNSGIPQTKMYKENQAALLVTSELAEQWPSELVTQLYMYIHVFHNSILWHILLSMHQTVKNGNWTE